MSGINFKGVEEAKEVTMTRPGTIDVFEIKEVKFDSSKNKGTYYMGVTFARKADYFNHSFYLSEKALPRVKSLVKMATGNKLEDEIQEEQLIKMLQGKKLALKVTGKIDEENGRSYPDLSFGGFGTEVAEIGKLEFNEKELALNKKSNEMGQRSNVATADKPDSEFSTAAPAATAAATVGDGPKEDDLAF